MKKKIIVYEVENSVNVRKYSVDTIKLKDLLGKSLSKSKLKRKDIAERLSVPLTKVDHWFRKDKYFAIPDKEYWFQLKKLLGISTNEFDLSITEFVEVSNKFDMQNRIYDARGVAPTMTSVNADKTILTFPNAKNRIRLGGGTLLEYGTTYE